MSATHFIVRRYDYPLRFPGRGRAVLVERVANDADATPFATREEAIEMCRRRGVGIKGTVIIEVPARPEEKL